MRKILFSVFLFVFFQINPIYAWEGMPMPKLRVEGRYLKDSHGHIVNLHGFAQTYSPWFNEENSKWNNYNINGCLTYNKGIIDKILAAGWKMNFIRLHMDPYWSNTPGCTGRYEGEECFNETRFRKYLSEVFVPMAEYAVSKGLYVVMRPPGVSPDHIEIDGVYHKYLIKVWGIVSKHPKLMNNPHIMFELANEPIDILGPDGTYGAGTQGHFDNLKTYFQTIVDVIRTSAENILWIPGLGYQSLYAGYAANPIEGQNIGYAVHVYPGWFNSGQGYESFQRGWNNQVQPVADFAPVIVTEMDWAPERHGKSWGKDSTGTAGGDGFGANFQKITDDCGNVSWLLFTSPDLLAQFGNPNAPAKIVDFLTDPEACPTPIHKWFGAYADQYAFDGVSNDYLAMTDLKISGDTVLSLLTHTSVGLKVNAVFADGHVENVGSTAQITTDNPDVVKVVRGRIYSLNDGHANIHVSHTDSRGTKKELTLKLSSSTFPLTNALFNPDIWENGTFDETTHTLRTGQWGFGGWQFDAINLSGYKYIVAKLASANTADVNFNIYDGSSYWGSPASYKFGSSKEVVVVLNQARKNDGSMLNPAHIYIAGFWSNGSNPFVIDSVFLSNSSAYDPPVVYASDLQGTALNELKGFQYEQDFGPSACQTLVVSGNLLTTNITITAPAGFEVSKDSIQSFSSMVTLAQSNGKVAATNVYVRMKAGLTKSPGKLNLTLASTGAFSKTLALNGIVGPVTGIYKYRTPATIVSTRYYSIAGQRLNSIENMNGVFIVKKLMSDGTIQTSKVVLQR